ncbi:hypothetical protein F53441_2340 [Fusarium austroafricanum]|uniref:Uncharacterized protein n=1 Tax=Fusarium austroafricanum TaxID=2364996 RepID=A0A8H4P180_9HYPO|nr:hypothetical protein F53441_2340 [Fusarium austroafricanum]
MDYYYYTGGLSAEEIRRLDRIMDLEWMEFAEGWEWHALNYINPIPPIIPYPSYCVSRRCGWCRFLIKPGELITARASGGTESTAFASCDSFNDNNWYATFRRCTSDHDSCATNGYHVECSEIASKFGLGKKAFVQVAKYSYEPSVQEDERRREWISNHLHQLMSDKFANIPPEILLMVNKYLFLYYTIASLSHVSQPDQCTIEPLRDVWATHFNLDGVEYIASLSNSPQPGSRLLWKAVEEQEESFLYISEDHLGIRQITNNPTGVSIEKQDNSGWWRTLPITSKTLSFSDDGLKLRNFAAAPLNPTICWQHPMSPASLNNMAYHVTKDSSSSLGMTIEARMVALDFNEPAITGYSACWFKDQLVDLRLHKSGESLDFYREVEDNQEKTRPATKSETASEKSHPYWVYQPLNQGERVEQVWLHTRKGSEDNKDSSDERQPQASASVPFADTTIASRTLIMGRANTAHGEWKCISKGWMDSPMRVYFNPRLDGVSLFAAPTVAGSDKDLLPARLPTQSETETDPVECSEASLESVKDIVVCRDNDLISGLLFRYQDDRQVCVGKFRLDHAEEPLSVAGSSSLYLGSRSDQDKRSVQGISLSTPEYEEGWEWKKFSWKGNLVWNSTSGFVTGLGAEIEQIEMHNTEG